MRAFILDSMADNDMWQSASSKVSRAGSNRGGNGDASLYGSESTSRGSEMGGVTLFDRVPPHDVDAEMAVLGGMLMSKDAIGEVSQVLDRKSVV